MASQAPLNPTPQPEPPSPISAHDLAIQWNQQADPAEQWDTLEPYEQLAWAQSRAIAADRARNPTPQPPADGEVGELVETLKSIAYWRRHGKPGGLAPAPFDIRQADRLDRAADLLERLASPACYVLDADTGAVTVLEGRPVPVGDRLPELRGVFERIVFTSSHVSHIRLADRLIDAVLTWLPASAIPTPEAND